MQKSFGDRIHRVLFRVGVRLLQPQRSAQGVRSVDRERSAEDPLRVVTDTPLKLRRRIGASLVLPTDRRMHRHEFGVDEHMCVCEQMPIAATVASGANRASVSSTPQPDEVVPRLLFGITLSRSARLRSTPRR